MEKSNKNGVWRIFNNGISIGSVDKQSNIKGKDLEATKKAIEPSPEPIESDNTFVDFIKY